MQLHSCTKLCPQTTNPIMRLYKSLRSMSFAQCVPNKVEEIVSRKKGQLCTHTQPTHTNTQTHAQTCTHTHMFAPSLHVSDLQVGRHAVQFARVAAARLVLARCTCVLDGASSAGHPDSCSCSHCGRCVLLFVVSHVSYV